MGTHTGMSNAQVRLISEPGALLAARIRNEMSATWEVNDICNGLGVLKKAGIQGYNAFRDLNFVPMPSVSTLNSWCSNVGSLPGVLLLKPPLPTVENLKEKPEVQITVKEEYGSALEKTSIQSNPGLNIQGQNPFGNLNFVPMPPVSTLNVLKGSEKVGFLPIQTPTHAKVKEEFGSSMEIETTSIQSNPGANIQEDPESILS